MKSAPTREKRRDLTQALGLPPGLLAVRAALAQARVPVLPAVSRKAPRAGTACRAPRRRSACAFAQWLRFS
jgi:hypothetical protein